MKIIKKVGICFLTLLMAFGLNSAILYAQENIQDGLNVTLETDKDSYGETDAVKAEVKVENQNDVVMKNIHIETVVPEGFTLADTSKASLAIAALNGKDSVSLSSEFKADVKQNGGKITIQAIRTMVILQLRIQITKMKIQQKLIHQKMM